MRSAVSLPAGGDDSSLSSLGGGSRGRNRSPPRRPADLPLQTCGRSPSRAGAATPARSASRAATPARSASRAATTGQSAFVSPASPPQQQQATASSSGSVPQVPVAAAPLSAVAGSGTLSSDAALSVIQAQSSQIQAQSAQISELMQIVKGLGRLQEQALAA